MWLPFLKPTDIVSAYRERLVSPLPCLYVEGSLHVDKWSLTFNDQLISREFHFNDSKITVCDNPLPQSLRLKSVFHLGLVRYCEMI